MKSALTRKLGPLPAWVWLATFGVAYYLYRRYTGNSVSGTGTGSVGPAAVTPQPITTLPPGYSAYDPNSGALSTAPGGGLSGTSDTTATSAADLTAAMDNLASAIASGMPPTQVDINYTPTSNVPSGGGGGTGTPATGGKTTKKSKPRGQTKRQAAKHVLPGSKSRPHGPAAIVRSNGGRGTPPRPTGATRQAPSYRSSSHTPAAPSRARQRAKMPAIVHVIQQRPSATYPRPANRSEPVPAPRPSAPQQRTVRSPTRSAPRPPARRRAK